MAVLLTLGLVPGLVAGNFSMALLIAAYPLFGAPWGAMLVGLLCSRREEWRDTRPPRPLVLGAVALPVVMGLLFGFGVIQEDVGLSGIAAALYVVLILVFLVGVHLMFSAGWAVVLFAAVMSSIRPKPDQISQLLEDRDGE